MVKLKDEVERLRYLPKLADDRSGRFTIDWPSAGSKRIRCFRNGVEVDPTNMFSKDGKTNWEKLWGEPIQTREVRYTENIEVA